MAEARGGDPTKETKEELRALARKSEEALAEAGRRFAEAIGELVPRAPERAHKLVDDVFDAMDTFAKSQREFAHSVCDALVGAQPAKKRPPAKRAATTRKAPARKRPAA